jgi:hypothetical protein
MRNGLLCIATLVAFSTAGGAVRAQLPVYSFETVLPAGPDGFFGLGATVAQDTIGATHLPNSMRYAAGNDGFVGARTETVPASLNDPPGVDFVLFDMTVTDAFAGTFADIGVSVFGHALNAPGGAQFGHQAQFADRVSIAALGVGTHLNQRIDLDTSQGPYRAGESFNSIFGPGPTDLTVASAFQFYISKNSGVPVTVYIDNVRLGRIPEPTTCLLLAMGAMALGTIGRRGRR